MKGEVLIEHFHSVVERIVGHMLLGFKKLLLSKTPVVNDSFYLLQSLIIKRFGTGVLSFHIDICIVADGLSGNISNLSYR